jgi:hypothetical protein
MFPTTLTQHVAAAQAADLYRAAAHRSPAPARRALAPRRLITALAAPARATLTVRRSS